VRSTASEGRGEQFPSYGKRSFLRRTAIESASGLESRHAATELDISRDINKDHVSRFGGGSAGWKIREVDTAEVSPASGQCRSWKLYARSWTALHYAPLAVYCRIVEGQKSTVENTCELNARVPNYPDFLSPDTTAFSRYRAFERKLYGVSALRGFHCSRISARVSRASISTEYAHVILTLRERLSLFLFLLFLSLLPSLSLLHGRVLSFDEFSKYWLLSSPIKIHDVTVTRALR